MPLPKSEREKLSKKKPVKAVYTKIKEQRVFTNKQEELSIWTCPYCKKVHRGFKKFVCRNENCPSNIELKKDDCVACCGTGNSSDGLRCYICKGTGKKRK